MKENINNYTGEHRVNGEYICFAISFSNSEEFHKIYDLLGIELPDGFNYVKGYLLSLYDNTYASYDTLTRKIECMVRPASIFLKEDKKAVNIFTVKENKEYKPHNYNYIMGSMAETNTEASCYLGGK